ncbi:MAG: acyl carrier protein [Xanthomonadales bacterium]|jgi:acyl carrier protein|nr:acyl carrier protein [Xanthomonadales bacterium]
MSLLNDTRAEILALIAERLALEKHALEQFRASGRLDEVTAADSMLLVEVVMLLEEHFGIRFEPEHLDAELLCDLDRLAAHVAAARSAG